MNHQAPTPSLPLKTGITPRNFPTQGREHAYIYKGVTSAHRNVGIRAARLQSDDLLVRKRSKARLVENLDKLSVTLNARRFTERLTGRHGEYAVKKELAKLDGVRRRMRECGTRWRILSCVNDHNQPSQNLNRCDHRLCPFCAQRRARKLQRKYAPRIGAFMRYAPVPVTPCSMVLTVKHKDGESALQSFIRLYDAFKKLIRRKLWKRYFLGGLWSFETFVSEKDGCWHSHMHLIVFRKRWVTELDALKADWLAVTGDSHNLWLKQIQDIRSGVKECVKYMNKPSDFDRMTPDHIRQLLEFRSRRLVSAFGEFAEFCKTYEVTDEDQEEWCDRHVDELKQDDPCPDCGQPLIEIVATVDEITDLCFRVDSRTAKARGAPKIPC